MAVVLPYKAVLPRKNKVAEIASRSFETYTEKGLKNMLASNPNSFLQIIQAGHQIPSNSLATRHKKIREKYNAFKDAHLLNLQTEPFYYVYQMKNSTDSFTGILAVTSAADYQKGIIKKHEKTIRKREKLFANYLKNVGFNAEPVLLTYPDVETINTITNSIVQTEALFSFIGNDHYTHTIWGITNTEDFQGIQSEFNAIDNLYIADGHHRTASSSELASQFEKENPTHSGTEPYNYFLSFLIPETGLKIVEFNRIVVDILDFNPAEFLKKISNHFTITSVSHKDTPLLNEHQFSLYLAEQCYVLSTKSQKNDTLAKTEKLNTQLLFDQILQPMLGIQDIRKSKNIRYLPGDRSLQTLKDQVINEKGILGFGMCPISITQLKALADKELTMPPKSTYVLPKLLSGLMIYEFE